MIKKILLTALIVLAISCNTSNSQTRTNTQTSESIKVEIADSIIDGYWIRLPYNYNEDESWPVLVYFHGGGSLEKDLENLRDDGPAFYALRDSSEAGELRNQIFSNFIIISPHLRGTGEIYPLFYRSWTKEVKTIDAILDTVLDQYSCNREKLYFTGFSLGGGASWLLPNFTKHSIAAVVPVCGRSMGYFAGDPRQREKTSTEPNEQFSPTPFKTVPVWMTCNARDNWPTRVFQLTAVKEIEAIGGESFFSLLTAKPTDSEYLKHRRIFTNFDKTGHDAWSATYSSVQIYKWMLSLSNRNGEIIQELQ